MHNLSLVFVNTMVHTLKCLSYCVIFYYVFPACFEFSKAGLYHLASHVCSLSHNPPPPPPPLVLQSVVDLGFQCSLPPFLSLAIACLFFIPIILNPHQPHLSDLYWSSSFSCSFHFSCCNLFWNSLVLHSCNTLDGGIL